MEITEKGYTLQTHGPMLTFDGPAGANGCKDCARYVGQRHSQKWWADRDLLRRDGNTNYECGRWKTCSHDFFLDGGEPFDMMAKAKEVAEKAVAAYKGYNPSEARLPAGGPGGGEWSGVAPGGTVPTSSKFRINGSLSSSADDLRSVIRAVDYVHSLPKSFSQIGVSKGNYSEVTVSRGENPRMTMRPDDLPGTIVHEMGHYIDANFSPKTEAVTVSPKLSRVVGVIKGTDAYKSMLDDAFTLRRIQTGKTFFDSALDYLSYHLRPSELWARAYHQFVGQRSGHPLISDYLNTKPGLHWDAGDFSPVDSAIEALFKSEGWM